MTIYASVADTKKNLSALLNQVTYGHERVLVTKRGKVVAQISLPSGAEGLPLRDPLLAIEGLGLGYPEVCDAIDEAYASRREERSRPVPNPITGELEE